MRHVLHSSLLPHFLVTLVRIVPFLLRIFRRRTLRLLALLPAPPSSSLLSFTLSRVDLDMPTRGGAISYHLGPEKKRSSTTPPTIRDWMLAGGCYYHTVPRCCCWFPSCDQTRLSNIMIQIIIFFVSFHIFPLDEVVNSPFHIRNFTRETQHH